MISICRETVHNKQDELTVRSIRVVFKHRKADTCNSKQTCDKDSNCISEDRHIQSAIVNIVRLKRKILHLNLHWLLNGTNIIMYINITVLRLTRKCCFIQASWHYRFHCHHPKKNTVPNRPVVLPSKKCLLLAR